jgi:hypothetical protein
MVNIAFPRRKKRIALSGHRKTGFARFTPTHNRAVAAAGSVATQLGCRFTLRTLFIATTFLAVVLGMVAWLDRAWIGKWSGASRYMPIIANSQNIPCRILFAPKLGGRFIAVKLTHIRQCVMLVGGHDIGPDSKHLVSGIQMIDAEQDFCEIDETWRVVALKTRLPETATNFFDQSGPANLVFQSQRRFHRFYSRGKAVLNRDGTHLGIFTKDISRDGLGFLSPVELTCHERLDLHVAGAPQRIIEVTRCRRVDERCYDCGAIFVAAQWRISRRWRRVTRPVV